MKGWVFGLLFIVSASVFSMEDVPLPLDHADAAVPLSAPSSTKMDNKRSLREKKITPLHKGQLKASPRSKKKVISKHSPRQQQKIRVVKTSLKKDTKKGRKATKSVSHKNNNPLLRQANSKRPTIKVQLISIKKHKSHQALIRHKKS